MGPLAAPLWPRVGSLWLLLTGAALAPPPNFPGPKFESKGKEGWSCVWTPTLGPGEQCWGLTFQPGDQAGV